MLQFLVLAHAGEFPSLTNWSDVIRLLEALGQKQSIHRATPRRCRRRIWLTEALSTY